MKFFFWRNPYESTKALTMKQSTIVFNIAAVVAVVGLFIAFSDLLRHKTTSYGVVTKAPVEVSVTVQPAA